MTKSRFSRFRVKVGQQCSQQHENRTAHAIIIHRKKERRRERKQDFRRATINLTLRAYLRLAKTNELMHDGGEMTIYNRQRRTEAV